MTVAIEHPPFDLSLPSAGASKPGVLGTDTATPSPTVHCSSSMARTDADQSMTMTFTNRTGLNLAEKEQSHASTCPNLPFIMVNDSPCDEELETAPRRKTETERLANDDFDLQDNGGGERAGEYVCEVCQKVKKRKGDLKKHMKRHTRPYGCTFPACHERFGSRNDWNRHESGHYLQFEAWRCEIPNAKSHAKCAYLARHEHEFVRHLEVAHGVDEGTDKNREFCRGMHLDRYGWENFWCGFCNRIIDQPERCLDTWRERRKHIRDHFDKDNMHIDDWVDIVENRRKCFIQDEARQDSAELSAIDRVRLLTGSELELPARHLSNVEKARVTLSDDKSGGSDDDEMSVDLGSGGMQGRKSTPTMVEEVEDGDADQRPNFKEVSTHHVAESMDLHMATGVAQSMTDEGYYSADKQAAAEVVYEDSEIDTDSVRTDNRDSGLNRDTKDQLSECFAQEILNDLRLKGTELTAAVEKICVSLPELLREFSILVERQAEKGLEEKACIFVRHQRK